MRVLTAEDIKHRKINDDISFSGPLTENIPALRVRAIDGAGELVIGICVDGIVLNREPHNIVTGAPRETTDQLMIRAAKELVPNLSEAAPRHKNGVPIGYLVYEGLPADHCRPK